MSNNTHTVRDFLPAAGRHWALPLYDPFTRLSGVDRARRELIADAAIGPDARVLDVGCGTGTLLAELGAHQPGALFAGLDPDPAALARTRGKLERAGVRVELASGSADALPYADGSFDHVFSSLMYHHLATDQKSAMLREIHRVLRPGGAFHLLDFTDAAAWLHAGHRLKDNDPERIVAALRAAGFADARVSGERRLWIGHVARFRATR